MVSWKTLMNPIYLQENDTYNLICQYNTVTGHFEKKTRQELGLDSIEDAWTGFAKYTDNDVVGVFASTNGPVFFINEKMYPLSENEWDFFVEPENDTINIFSFIYNGEKVYETRYKRVTCLDVHAFADEEFMDFFIWMSLKKKSPMFLTYYTVQS
jgi:hypothetical protein